MIVNDSEYDEAIKFETLFFKKHNLSIMALKKMTSISIIPYQTWQDLLYTF